MLQRPSRTDKDFKDEIESHIALEQDRLIAEGMNAEQARLEAVRRFGNVVETRERFYESHRRLWLDHFRRDLRYAFAQLARYRAFTAVALLTLAVGIGASITIFSIVDGVLLRPLPYNNPQQLVAIWDRSALGDKFDKEFDSSADFELYRKSSQTLDGIAAATWAGGPLRTMKGAGPPQSVIAVPVSEDFFELLGVAPLLGRTFDRSDLNGGCSVVLSHSFWQETFQSRSDVASQNISLDDDACQIRGVMPAGFSFYPDGAPLWILMTPAVRLQVAQFGVGIFGRLKSGITIDQARSEINTLHAALHQNDRKEVGVQPIVLDLQGEFTWLASRNLRATVWVLFAAVNILLLIACLNIGSLILGQSLSREREMAVRIALGSGRWRLIRQFLTEALLLALIGGAGGVALAAAGIHYFRSASPVELPVGAVISLRPAELGFALAVSVATVVVFGLVPAWKVSSVDVTGRLKGSTRGVTRTRTPHSLASSLIILQTALAVVLVVSAALLMSSVLKLGAAAPGFETDRVFAASVRLPANRYADEAKRSEFFSSLQERLSGAIRPAEVALTSGLPPFGDAYGNKLEIDGIYTENTPTNVSDQAISANYFQLMAESLRSGRAFNTQDQWNSEPVGVVNEALVQRYLPDRNPIGLRIRVGDRSPWLTIVGVVANEKYSSLQEMTWVERPVVFRPVTQDARRSMMIAIRTADGQAGISDKTQHVLAALDNNIPAPRFETLRYQLSRYVLAYPQFRTVILGGFAGFALLLTAIGIYGLMACSVQRRQHEIGIRIALGAEARDVGSMVVIQAMRLVWIGSGIGVLAAVATSRIIKDFLYGVDALEAVILLSVPLMLTIVTIIAVWLPARRAIGLDPIVTLRSE